MTLQALLTSERAAAEETKKAHADAAARNSELVRKLEDTERKADQLQDSVQRSVRCKYGSKLLHLMLLSLYCLVL